MKKTVSINLGGRAFIIEDEGFVILDTYLKQLKRSFADDPSVDELVNDIEVSIADKFAEKIGQFKQVITAEDAQSVIDVMGHVEEITDVDVQHQETSQTNNEESAKNQIPKRLYRDADDVVIAGVCSGLAAYFGIDPVFFRVGFAVLGFFSGFGILLYIILWISLPVAETSAQKLEMRGKPTNVNEIKELVKEKAQDMKKEGEKVMTNMKDKQSTLYKLVNSPFKFLGMVLTGIKRFLGVVLPVFLWIIGLILFIASIIAISGATAAMVVLIFRIDSAYFLTEIPLTFLSSNPLYHVGVIALYVLIIIPLIALAMISIGMMRRKNTLHIGMVVFLSIAWIVSFGLAIASGSEIAPIIDERFREIERVSSITQIFQVEGFNRIEVNDNYNVEIKQGEIFSAQFTGRKEELQLVDLKVINGTLHIAQKERLKPMFCLFCITHPVTGVITIPKLDTITGKDNSRITMSSINALKAMTVEDNGQIYIENVSTTSLVIKAQDNAYIRMDGLSDTLNVEAEDNAYVLIGGLRSGHVQMLTKDNVYAEVDAIKTLSITSSGNSRVKYTKAIEGMQVMKKQNARVWSDEMYRALDVDLVE